MVICLERGADLHMVLLMPLPLPLTASSFSKILIGFISLVPVHPGSPRKRAFKRVCVCVYHKNSIIIRTLFTIIASLKSGLRIIHVN